MTDAIVASQPQLTLAGAQQILDHAQRLAGEQQLRLCFAVVDSAGQLIAFQRMDGVGLVSIDVAIGKARTAAYLKSPSRVFEEMIDSGAPSMLATPGLVPLRGGVPITVDGAIVGAVGVSGASGDQDEAIAEQVSAALRP